MRSCCLLVLIASSATALSPVTRVVDLLKGLSDKIEKEGKVEEDLFESFVCWGKSVIAQKTASNAAAASRIGTLEAYIADLNSGRVTLSSEGADLEKDIAELMSDMEQADALRKKEKADFNDAEAEMTNAITALASAREVLGKATKDHKEGVLLAIHARLHQGESLSQQRVNLDRAVKLGEKFLDKADATFLRRLLNADVPKADWKKLNRKANFKMAYKARSFKIQDVLAKMHSTFKANLDDATQSEAEAQSQYDKLTSAKGEQLKAAQDALSKGALEDGKRGASRQDSQDELDSLKTQVTADEGFITQTAKDLADKKEAWKVRSTLRSGELAAVSKAISILHSDDARDNFKKSEASQESLFFLQVSQQSTSAASVLRIAAEKSGDSRLLSLSKLLASGPSVKTAFGPIITAIDKMVSLLGKEEQDDLRTKEECEQGRMEDTREAALTSRDIDEKTDAMSKLTQEIEQLTKDIASLKEERANTKQELKEASDLRKKENTQWKVSDSEDAEAAETVKSAQTVLENFYKDAGLMFVQKSVAPVVEAGEAPPPPPSTFDAPYGGATGESQGISAILGMIHEDILSDQKKGKAEEDAAQGSFDKLKKDSEDEMKAQSQDIDKKKGLKGKKETERVDTEGARKTKKESLDALVEKMEGINPNCEYFTVNYKMRADNRDVEKDGLVKAKAILQGGSFSKGPDPNREMKPGDAFLQRKA